MVNSGLWWTVLLVIELTFLFNLSVAVSKLISRFSVHFLVVLFFPGTLVHELSHVLMSLVLFVPIHGLSLAPRFGRTEIRLGYAQISQTDRFRRGLIGIAPLLFGIALLISGLWFFSFYAAVWVKIAALLLVFEISNTMFSSKKDQEGLWEFLGIVGLIVGLVLAISVFLHIKIAWEHLAELVFQPPLLFFLKRSFSLLLVPVGLDVAFLLMPKLVRRT